MNTVILNRLCLSLHAVLTSRFTRSSFGRITARRACKFSPYDVSESGSPNSVDYKLYFRNTKSNIIISPFHDIPVWPKRENKTTIHMVVEMPRWTNLKMEISKEDRFNPIKQVSKQGKLGFAANFFPYHGYIWNYGSIPQTWANPKVVDECTGGIGDNDPIDVLEIGYKVANKGDVLEVNVLGVLAVINDGKADWKVITIDSKDPLASQIKELRDVDTYYPGLLEATTEWFRVYKVPNGGMENEIAFKGKPRGQECAIKVIEELHTFWCCLMMNISDRGTISCDNTTINESPYKIDDKKAREFFKSVPKPEEPKVLNPIVNTWHFLHSSCYAKQKKEKEKREKEIAEAKHAAELKRKAKEEKKEENDKKEAIMDKKDAKIAKMEAKISNKEAKKAKKAVEKAKKEAEKAKKKEKNDKNKKKTCVIFKKDKINDKQDMGMLKKKGKTAKDKKSK